MHTHPKQPYTHRLDKVCGVDGCKELGDKFICNICGGIKMKKRCEYHRYQASQLKKILAGKLKGMI